MKQKEINELVKKCLETGNWMLRRSDNGVGYNGFKWAPIGQWTEAPDWDPSATCGGGLHGNGPKSSGHWALGESIEFCEVDTGDVVDIDGEKIKCKRARILMRNELPDNLSLSGDLYLGDTQITSLPDNLSVGCVFGL